MSARFSVKRKGRQRRLAKGAGTSIAYKTVDVAKQCISIRSTYTLKRQVGTGKQLVAIYNVSFGRQILNWTVQDDHYIWRPTVSLYLCKSSYLFYFILNKRQ